MRIASTEFTVAVDAGQRSEHLETRYLGVGGRVYEDRRQKRRLRHPPASDLFGSGVRRLLDPACDTLHLSWQYERADLGFLKCGITDTKGCDLGGESVRERG